MSGSGKGTVLKALEDVGYYSVDNLLELNTTWFQLYSGRVSTNLNAFEAIVGKKIPLAPLEEKK